MIIDEQCVKLCCPIKSQVRFYFFELSAFEEGILFTQQDITYNKTLMFVAYQDTPL